MRILVTGAAGFVGSHLLDRLEEGNELFPLVRTAQDADREWIVQDLSEPLDIARLPKRIDAVIHLAQSRRYREFPNGAEDMYAINVHSTFHLLEYARKAGAQSFLLASTGGIYGYSYEALVETSPANPLNFYLTSKHVAESLVGNYQAFFRTVVFRFFFAYGPGQEGMVVPTLLEKVRKGTRSRSPAGQGNGSTPSTSPTSSRSSRRRSSSSDPTCSTSPATRSSRCASW